VSRSSREGGKRRADLDVEGRGIIENGLHSSVGLDISLLGSSRELSLLGNDASSLESVVESELSGGDGGLWHGDRRRSVSRRSGGLFLDGRRRSLNLLGGILCGRGRRSRSGRHAGLDRKVGWEGGREVVVG